MSRFYADIQGNRGGASRMGTKSSGISGHIRGWNVGCKVSMDSNEKDEDTIYIALTSGSNGYRSSITLLNLSQSEADAILDGRKRIEVKIKRIVRKQERVYMREQIAASRGESA